MYQSVGIVLCIVCNANSQAHLQRRTQARLPKPVVNDGIREGQHAHGDRTLLIMSDSDEIASFIHNPHKFSFFYAFIHLANGTREHPRMEALQAFILTFT